MNCLIVWCRGDVGKCDPFDSQNLNGYRFTKKSYASKI